MDERGSGSRYAEVVRLVLPHEERFLNVARILVGGLAARLDLPFASLDDLQLGVETVLADERYRAAPEVTVEITIVEDSLEVVIEPLLVERLAADLAGESEGLDLQVLLSAVVDDFRFEPDGAEGGRVRLNKRIPPTVGT